MTCVHKVALLYVAQQCNIGGILMFLREMSQLNIVVQNNTEGYRILFIFSLFPIKASWSGGWWLMGLAAPRHSWALPLSST